MTNQEREIADMVVKNGGTYWANRETYFMYNKCTSLNHNRSVAIFGNCPVCKGKKLNK